MLKKKFINKPKQAIKLEPLFPKNRPNKPKINEAKNGIKIILNSIKTY